MNDAPVLFGSPEATGLRHMLFPYTGTRDYLRGLAAYAEQALAAGGRVVVCVPEERRELLRGHLPDGDSVVYTDGAKLGGNPGRLIPAWREWVTDRSAEGPVYGIGESVWNKGSTARLSELRYHEWLLNLAFAQPPPWSLLCPYDTHGQSDAAVHAVMRAHPLVWDGGEIYAGRQYAADPYVFEPFSDPSGPYGEMAYTINELTALRQLVMDWAASCGLSADRARDLLLAVTEVASNSIRHGGGRGLLRVWAADGALVCEFRDAGVIQDPLVGRVRPAADQIGGCGLWFVHQLCDLVQMRSGRGEGTRVRLHMELSAGARGEEAA